MGNLLSSNKYTLNTISDYKLTAGTTSEPVYEGKNIPEELIGLFSNSSISSMLDQVRLSENDRQLLNRFLTEMHNHLKTNFNTDTGTTFPDNCETGKLLISSLVSEEEINEEHLKLIGSDVESVDKSKVKSVKKYQCVYKFPEENMRMYEREQLVSNDTVKVGISDSELMLFSPDTIPEETSKILFKWYVYELDEGEVYVAPIEIRGVQVENGKIVTHNMNQLNLLIEAGELVKENNDRAMKSKLDQFKKWKEEILEKGETYALVGGNVVGNLESLADFFDNLEILE